MSEKQQSLLANTCFLNNKLYTENLTPGTSFYGEKLVNVNAREYRHWDPFRSKLAALILNGCTNVPINSHDNLLYLGAADGKTPSHVSDIVKDGRIYCIEFAPRSFRNLLNLAESRKNIFPILEDASYPQRYRPLIGNIDVIYQDISHREQVQIFISNARMFLKPGKFGIFMIKSRSIDVTKAPKAIFDLIVQRLKSERIKILSQIDLNPYSKDHLGLVLEIK